MKKKLYVGNLVEKTNDSDLYTLFSQVGTVKSAIVFKNLQSGRSMGFGFVDMSTLDEAEAAIIKFNGIEFEGRVLIVSYHKPSGKKRSAGSKGNPRLDGDSTTNAPPPDVRKKKKGRRSGQ